MDESRWERYGAGAGITFVVLLVVGLFIAPQPPHVDASVAKIASYFADHSKAVLASGMFGTLSVLAFVWFLGHLRHVLQRAEGGAEALSPVVFTAGTALAALAVISALPMTLLAFMARSGTVSDDAVIRTLYDMNWLTF